jgi:hypothetical protein
VHLSLQADFRPVSSRGFASVSVVALEERASAINCMNGCSDLLRQTESFADLKCTFYLPRSLLYLCAYRYLCVQCWWYSSHHAQKLHTARPIAQAGMPLGRPVARSPAGHQLLVWLALFCFLFVFLTSFGVRLVAGPIRAQDPKWERTEQFALNHADVTKAPRPSLEVLFSDPLLWLSRSLACLLSLFLLITAVRAAGWRQLHRRTGIHSDSGRRRAES